MDFHFLFYREMRGRTEAEFAKRQEKMGKNMVEQDLRVTKKSLYETVADRIEDMILDNSLQQGERLPSEQELATRFGISRNVMRESLKLLKERQLIVQRNGDGTYLGALCMPSGSLQRKYSGFREAGFLYPGDGKD